MILQVCLVVLGLLSLVNSQGYAPGVGDSCLHSRETGNCEAIFPSFYYRAETGSCDCFIYSGCNGNPNRFDTLNDCMKECNVPRNQQIISTTCRNIFSGTEILQTLLDQFDPRNNLRTHIRDQVASQGFDSLRPTSPPSVLPSSPTTPRQPPGIGSPCRYPAKMGDCKAFFPSFYYRTETGSCDCFVYSGCGGNPNRFDTLGECMNKCNVPRNKQTVSATCRNVLKGTDILQTILDQFGQSNKPQTDIRDQVPSQSFDSLRPTSPPSVLPTLPTTPRQSPSIGRNPCSFPVKMGNCKAFFPSFYYRAETGSCDCFVYSGCDGNPNRFDTLKTCMNKCNVPRNQQTISATCRAIFEGTDILQIILDQFDPSNKPQIDIRHKVPTPGFDSLRPNSPPSVSPTLPTTPRQPSRQPARKPSRQPPPRETSSLVTSFFTPARHFWQKDD